MSVMLFVALLILAVAVLVLAASSAGPAKLPALILALVSLALLVLGQFWKFG